MINVDFIEKFCLDALKPASKLKGNFPMLSRKAAVSSAVRWNPETGRIDGADKSGVEYAIRDGVLFTALRVGPSKRYRIHPGDMIVTDGARKILVPKAHARRGGPAPSVLSRKRSLWAMLF